MLCCYGENKFLKRGSEFDYRNISGTKLSVKQPNCGCRGWQEANCQRKPFWTLQRACNWWTSNTNMWFMLLFKLKYSCFYFNVLQPGDLVFGPLCYISFLGSPTAQCVMSGQWASSCSWFCIDFIYQCPLFEFCFVFFYFIITDWLKGTRERLGCAFYLTTYLIFKRE